MEKADPRHGAPGRMRPTTSAKTNAYPTVGRGMRLTREEGRQYSRCGARDPCPSPLVSHASFCVGFQANVSTACVSPGRRVTTHGVTARPPALASLIRELAHHPVNCNEFFRRFHEERLTRPRLQRFIGQYQYFCKHFVKVLEGLLYRTPLDQLDMRVELTRTLYSELGNGDPEQAHLTLLNRFAARLDLDEAALQRTEPVACVREYLRTLHELFLDGDYLTALGAELAVEVTAASEFRYLYPGLQQYAWFSEKDLAFFRLHVEEEVSHGDWLMDAVARTARSADDYERVAGGARRTADAWHAFWLGLSEEVFGAAGTRPGEKA